ncbi:MAG: sigma-70 family RNA polymerase sigma factor [Planctomycetes bacterium]|nr:sigma-70 family RNA polymerase sigma factor [Planctomycetota bacterium]
MVPQGVGPRTVTRDVGRLPDDETGLIVKAQTGDREAFATLVDRYWERLYRWLCHLTRDGHCAEDLAQETFMKAFAALQSFRAGSNFRAWLFRIAHNNYVNQRRSQRHNVSPLTLDFPEDDAGPEEEALSRETLRTLAEAIAKLPIDFRTALMMRAEADLSFKEIADIVNITDETARWRVFKARQKLMSILEPDLLPAPRETNRNSP